VSVWHWDGAAWSSFDAPDLNCSGGYANFTVTHFSGYAVSAVPEPSTLMVLLVGALVAVGFGSRRARAIRR
jgi:hypothetical protein